MRKHSNQRGATWQDLLICIFDHEMTYLPRNWRVAPLRFSLIFIQNSNFISKYGKFEGEYILIKEVLHGNISKFVSLTIRLTIYRRIGV